MSFLFFVLKKRAQIFPLRLEVVRNMMREAEIRLERYYRLRVFQ